VNIGGVAAPILFVGPTQINIQVPFEVPAGRFRVAVSTSGGSVTTEDVQFSTYAPGIFVALKNSNFSLISASNPVSAGEAIAVYATGLGAGSPSVATGALAGANPLSATATTPTATIGGVSAQVAASLLAPGFAGLSQVNVIVPAGAPTGSQSLQLSVGGVQSNAVLINVR
jgi:adhesin/invasin